MKYHCPQTVVMKRSQYFIMLELARALTLINKPEIVTYIDRKAVSLLSYLDTFANYSKSLNKFAIFDRTMAILMLWRLLGLLLLLLQLTLIVLMSSTSLTQKQVG